MTLPVRRNYRRDEIAEALEIYAESASIDETRAKLGRIWSDVPSRGTISNWKRTYPELYERGKQGVEQRRKGRIRGTRLQIIEQSGGTILEGLRQLDEAVQNREIPAKDLAMVVKALTVTWGIADDHMVRAEGMPTSIIEHRKTGEEALRSLQERGLAWFVDSDAEEEDEGIDSD